MIIMRNAPVVKSLNNKKIGFFEKTGLIIAGTVL